MLVGILLKPRGSLRFLTMTSQTAANTFKKLIHICNKNHILNIERLATGNNVTALQYGPLGSQLKRNIFNEWFCSLINNNDINIFPVEFPIPKKQKILLPKTTQESSSDLLHDVLYNYFKIHHRFGCSLPFGLAAYGPCLNKNLPNEQSSDLVNFDMLNDLEAWTHISVIFFCPLKKSLNWFHHWSKQRYLWWRKYSSIPSKFSMSDVTKTSLNDQQLSLLLENPWGKDQLETITLHDNKSVEEFCQKHAIQLGIDKHQQDSMPAIVSCDANLDLAVLAYLSNSYAEKWREDKNKNVFHLHYKLAPYKVSLALEDTDAEHLKKLKNVVNHLTKELKESGINVLPESNSCFSDPIHLNFEKCDEMGIPYIIVLNENSLQTGIAGLRNRDTTLQEEVHITELSSKLSKYLKMKS
ncbi:DNA polymerase subunit gamma-2, mitochondrial [Caerostris darwini]|uniref:DNA polymerase subunit gamma-2, mitochondrial n=1 Tax=Caerostris darwini TaxID=1538125 RepID=A0AAV4NL43_9ARAC|nr:DNA polymerase subunit gamma-2, mitochondrial [Caerostris darwini]